MAMGRRDPRRRDALGRAVQAIRAERGMRRRDLAEAAEISYPYLSEIENGKKEPSTGALTGIAEALGVALHELMRRAEELQMDIEGRPMAARMAAEPPRRPEWFHQQQQAARDMALAGPTMADATKGSEDPLKELTWLASQVSPEDLSTLLSLARRLRRGR